MGAAGQIHDDHADESDTRSAGVWCESHSARAVIATAIAASVRRLDAELPRARAGDDPEGVHQARVATRRLRSDLRTFAPLLDDAWRIQMRAELQLLADALGEVRDTDVLRMRLEAAIAEVGIADVTAGDELTVGGGAELLAHLDCHQHDAHRRLLDVIDDDRTTTLLQRLREAAADPPTTGRALGRATRRLLPLVRKPWRKLHRTVGALDDDPPISELHRVRLLAKRTRYAAEAVVPVFGRDAQRFARAVTGVQDVLGELNDAEQTIVWLRSAAGGLSAGGAFAAGQLVSHFHQVAAEHRSGWERSFARAERRSAWLG